MNENVYEKGILGELKAARFLKKEGMRILARRFRGAKGEVDLIAQDGRTIVFVEVKYRPDKGIGAGLEAVGADKRRRMKTAASAYLTKTGRQDASVRFDVVEITRAGTRLIRNAF